MNEDELVNRMYGQVKRHIASKLVGKPGLMQNALIYDWEIKNKARIKKGIRSLLHDKQSDNESLPHRKTVHVGDGIFVEEENPELNCEVG